MIMTLFFKECKQITKSIVYYIFLVIFVLFMVSQLGDESMTEGVKEPQPGQEYYGVKISYEENVIMEQTITGLMKETYRNSFGTYPLMFYKEVILNNQESRQIKDILAKAAGRSYEELEEEYEQHFSLSSPVSNEEIMEADLSYVLELQQNYIYEEFEKDMKKVCQIIGKGSSYEKEKYENGVEVAMTYEEAVEEYQAICEKDKITGAFARLFCDYAGIMLALLPLFLGVTRCLRDKRARAADVIYARNCSSWKVVLTRYAANVIMVFLPVLVVACIYQFPVFFRAGTMGITPDYFSFPWYSLVWLLPEIMIVLAVSFFITELTEGIWAVFIQVIWAFVSLSSTKTLSGDFGFRLIARWNELGSTMEFFAQRREFFINRGFYTVLAVLFVCGTVIVYEKKRQEGVTIFGKIFKNRG